MDEQERLIREVAQEIGTQRAVEILAVLMATIRERLMVREGLLVDITGLDRLTVRKLEDMGHEILDGQRVPIVPFPKDKRAAAREVE